MVVSAKGAHASCAISFKEQIQSTRSRSQVQSTHVYHFI